ncbi:hypothetical protein DLAC_11661 [Tieghemostelium lacteum]|uniref:Protein kinase domain-containing protein n=1 Tax=Tieghemostelium lacteum TaxID=361077 RepID=A0A151ZF89_TIELA|nr:hypothetical protein DLAC_11661 [Tieghemostelium lacteum]|eukprot:KYQ92642.1 hypothetical protein DLAC_11661 [Tieghemostelium lacteum]
MYLAEKEISILTTLRGTPNIVELYKVLDGGDEILLVMELVRGKTLMEMILKYRVFPENIVKRWMKQLSGAIYVAHRHSIIHRDLKPENIMVDNNGDIKIIDFGLGEMGRICNLKVKAGTRPYMSPEMHCGLYDGHVNDMWSLGVILFILVNGYHPFDADIRGSLRWYMRPSLCSKYWFKGIIYNTIRFNYQVPNYISRECKNLIEGCFKGKFKRINAFDFMTHPWFHYSRPEYNRVSSKCRTLEMSKSPMAKFF